MVTLPVAWLEGCSYISSEADAGVLAMKVTQVNSPEKVPAASVFTTLHSVHLSWFSAVCVCDSNVYLGVNCSSQREGEGGWDWD